MKKKESVKLKACPFCGGEPELWPMMGYDSPFCSHCGATVEATVTGSDTLAQVKAWNKRANEK